MSQRHMVSIMENKIMHSCLPCSSEVVGLWANLSQAWGGSRFIVVEDAYSLVPWCWPDPITERVCAQRLSHAQLSAAPWMVALMAPLSMGISSQEHWSGLPFLTPGAHPDLRDRTQLSWVSCTDGFFITELSGKPSATAGYLNKCWTKVNVHQS